MCCLVSGGGGCDSEPRKSEEEGKRRREEEEGGERKKRRAFPVRSSVEASSFSRIWNPRVVGYGKHMFISRFGEVLNYGFW